MTPNREIKKKKKVSVQLHQWTRFQLKIKLTSLVKRKNALSLGAWCSLVRVGDKIGNLYTKNQVVLHRFTCVFWRCLHFLCSVCWRPETVHVAFRRRSDSSILRKQQGCCLGTTWETRMRTHRVCIIVCRRSSASSFGSVRKKSREVNGSGCCWLYRSANRREKPPKMWLTSSATIRAWEYTSKLFPLARMCSLAQTTGAFWCSLQTGSVRSLPLKHLWLKSWVATHKTSAQRLRKILLLLVQYDLCGWCALKFFHSQLKKSTSTVNDESFFATLQLRWNCVARRLHPVQQLDEQKKISRHVRNGIGKFGFRLNDKSSMLVRHAYITKEHQRVCINQPQNCISFRKSAVT